MGAASYYSRINRDLLNNIPIDSSNILELGCGTGALGAAFKARSAHANYTGIELSKTASEIAAKNLDRVLNIDVSDLTAELLDKSYDCIIFGDVLEHLGDPEAVVKKLADHLSPTGVFLACIPNVQHWSTFRHLLEGNFPREDEGLFDKTHLRWFTLKNIIDLFSSCNHQIEWVIPRIGNQDEGIKTIESLKTAVQTLNIDYEEFKAKSLPLQYVVCTSKNKPEQTSFLGLTLTPQAGLIDVRMALPLQSLATKPGIELSLSSESLELKPGLQCPKFLIWQRQLFTYKNSLSMIKSALNAGYILISEYDDDPEFWPDIKENNYLTFTGVHAVQVSTDRLQQFISEHNSNCQAFPNCIQDIPIGTTKKWDDMRNNQRPIRFFFGALNRETDWQPFINTINQFIVNSGKNWEYEIVHDRAFYDALQTKNKRFTPTCGYQDYMSLLKESHVAFLPLSSNRFNSYKSDLKFIESSSACAISIASPTVYSEVIDHNITGMIFDNQTMLLESLNQIATDPNMAKQIALNAQNWVYNNRLISSQTSQRYDWYMSLWRRKNDLTAQLLERIPELAG